MTLFCLLWVPLFYVLWCSRSPHYGNVNILIPLLAGGCGALLYRFAGPFLPPGRFDMERWFHIAADVIAVPVLPPLILSLIPIAAGKQIDSTGFSLIYLIPVSAIHSVDKSLLNDPIYFVLPPILWTTVVVGIPFFSRLFYKKRNALIPVAVMAIIAVFLIAASSYWFFFCQQQIPGIVLLGLNVIPVFIALIVPPHRHDSGT
ncbi:hypothetical protein FACS1894172_02590 [Spirochaetia bacterium]|nr:hypothetical protein FACS1894164_08450 [Spirochaetia bacterium]GHU30090.1 hypothetical protein FACS1894172_02590 [Spirochaetia bacterium]